MSDRREQQPLVPPHDVSAQAETEPRDVPQAAQRADQEKQLQWLMTQGTASPAGTTQHPHTVTNYEI